MRDEYDTNVMMDEMKRLREELRVASMMIDELRDRVDRVEQNTSSSAVPSSETESGIGVSPDEAGIVNQAFKVVWIQRDGSDGGDYKVFAPEGCLYYDKKKVRFNVDDDNLASVDGIDGDGGGTIYCNVTKSGSGSEASYSATFSANDESSGEISFKVAKIPPDAESPVVQYVFGMVTFCVGVPPGGGTGQVLKKNSDDDFDLAWGDGGGGGTVEVDDISVGTKTSGEIEIKDYHDAADTEGDVTLARALTTDYGVTSESIERGLDLDGNPSDVKYRKLGSFKAGDETNLTFTTINGDVYINVYYK